MNAPPDLGEDEPKQPRKCDFKYDSEGRRFNAEWYSRFEWLEYSENREAAFCYPCRRYACEGMSENRKTFTMNGFSKWRRAVGDKEKGLLQHDQSKLHENATANWKQKLIRVETNKSVTLMISSDILEKRRYYAKSIAEIIQFLAINELAFRGSYDISEHEEKGLFNKLFSYTIQKDLKLAEIVEDIPKNATLKSPEVQNDVISLMAKIVTETIAFDVKPSDSQKFTVLADGTRNKANVENIAIAVRYVKQGEPKESLLTIKRTDELHAQALTDVIITTLEEIGIETSKILSQCYDGASCMSGNRGGNRLMQNQLGREIPYVHCKNHRLHLVVVDLVCGMPGVSQYFDEIGLLYNYFSRFKVDQQYCGKSLKRVLDTRWSGHYDSTVAVVDNFDDILHALIEIRRNEKRLFDAETVATSIGLMSIMMSQTFMLLSVTMKRILGVMKPADASLQQRETDINESMKLIDTSVSLLTSLRSEMGYAKIIHKFEKMNDTAKEYSSEETPLPKRKRTMNRNLDAYFVTERLPKTLGQATEDNVDGDVDTNSR